jgi:hypothetical protein
MWSILGEEERTWAVALLNVIGINFYTKTVRAELERNSDLNWERYMWGF